MGTRSPDHGRSNAVCIRKHTQAHPAQIRINSAGLHGPPRTIFYGGMNENRCCEYDKKRSKKRYQATSHVAHSNSSLAGSA